MEGGNRAKMSKPLSGEKVAESLTRNFWNLNSLLLCRPMNGPHTKKNANIRFVRGEYNEGGKNSIP